VNTPRIRCAICQKPVDAIEWLDDYTTRDRVIRVRCHGDTDEMRLPADLLIKLHRANALPSEGEAFTTQRITA
jgi:hypothetical protein